jgi:hypothetical protein
MGKLRMAIVLVLAFAITLAGVGVTPAAVGTDSAKLRRAVTTAGVMEHLKAFQDIANANGGTRVAGSPGYDASVDYVAQRLRKAGYDVSLQQFEFEFFEEREPAVFEQVSPVQRTYVEGFEAEFLTME